MFIRNFYEKYGVDNYYKKHGDNYKNYHVNEVRYLLENNIERIIDNKNNNILDLCSGNGEVTEILLNNGIKNIIGCDPYMSNIYENRLNRMCYKSSFMDIINGNFEGVYDIVICSFGMHLCDEKNIFSLLSMLKYEYGMRRLVIITPNKKPKICEELKYEEKYKRVRLRIYEN